MTNLGRLAFIVLGCVALASCSDSPASFPTWERSASAKARMLTLAAEDTATSATDSGRLMSIVAGNGSASPLQSLERYFLTLSPTEIEQSSAQQGLFTSLYLGEIAGTKKFKEDPSPDSRDTAMRRLWTVQLFRTLPLNVRVKTLSAKELVPFVDPKDPGALLPIEGAEIAKLGAISDALAKALSPSRTQQFQEFRTAAEAN
jgi:hypothetical protein